MPYKDKQREKEYKREYMRKYCQRDYVKARIKKNRGNPEVKRKRKEHAKEYKQRPEIKQLRGEGENIIEKIRNRFWHVLKKIMKYQKLKQELKNTRKNTIKNMTKRLMESWLGKGQKAKDGNTHRT